MTEPVQLLVRAVDAADTYLSWRWLDGAGTPDFAVLPAARVAEAGELLTRALLTRMDGESDDEMAQRVLRTGPLSGLDRERALALALTEAVLPAALRAQIAERAGVRLRIRLTPSPRLSGIPWELLFAGADQRLLEVAEIVHEPPAAVHVNRPRIPAAWQEVCELPALLVLGPLTPGSAAAHRLDSVLDVADARVLLGRVAEYVRRGRIPSTERSTSVAAGTTRKDLSAALQIPRSRLLYVGHVSSRADEPGSAALHLNDTAASWGMATPLSVSGPGERAVRDPGDHLPLTALDLFLGTTGAGEHAWSPGGGTTGAPGHELWPMPSRVALIVCHGHADFRSTELFGLIIAMIHAGAGLVTTTRWVLPADRTFRATTAEPAAHPIAELALRVDQAHEQPDPVADLVAWQRERLARWTSGRAGSGLDNPFYWACLTHTVAGHRPVRPLRS